VVVIAITPRRARTGRVEVAVATVNHVTPEARSIHPWALLVEKDAATSARSMAIGPGSARR